MDDSNIVLENEDWSDFLGEIEDILKNFCDSIELENVFITGSLGSRNGIPDESDLDIVIECDGVTNYKKRGKLLQHFREKESNLEEYISIPITYVQVVQVARKGRGAHVAMELQYQGQKLAKMHGKESDKKMMIFDINKNTYLSSARSAY